VFPQGGGQGPGVDLGQGRHARLAQHLIEAEFTAAVKIPAAEIPYDHRGRMDGRRFMISPVDAVIPDVGSREDDDLPGVTRIGQYFLIPGHPGMEDDLATGLLRRAEQPAGKNTTVFQSDECFHQGSPRRLGPGGVISISLARRSMGSIRVSITEPSPIRYCSRWPRPRLKPARGESPGRTLPSMVMPE